jgi:hypothetical protein
MKMQFSQSRAKQNSNQRDASDDYLDDEPTAGPHGRSATTVGKSFASTLNDDSEVDVDEATPPVLAIPSLPARTAHRLGRHRAG